jgi:Ca2+-binding RTX toxin-like protein
MPYDLTGQKWTRTTQVTWSFADFDLEPGLAKSYTGYPDFSASIDGRFRDLIRQAFATWDLFADLDFREVSDSVSADIRLGERFIDGRPAAGGSTTLGVASSWWNQNGYEKAAISFDIDAFDSDDRFYWTALHEIGHTLGLDHSPSTSDLMYGFLNAQNRQGVSLGDVQGIQALYGSEGGRIAILGTAAGDTLTGDDAANLIYAKGGADTIIAGGGADLIYAASGSFEPDEGADSIIAGDGADTVYGFAGADLIYGNQGNDLIYGNLDADRLFGGQGSDVIYMGQGNDIAYGNLAADVVYGNLGNDVLFGGQGADTLFGGQGDDLLQGNRDADLLVGGLGADTFVFGPDTGADTISGFDFAGGDRIGVQGQSYTVRQTAGGAVLDLSGGAVLVAGATSEDVSRAILTTALV